MSKVVYQKTKGLTDVPLSYCPGCTHGILHKLVGEVLEELNLLGRSVGIASVGCSALSYDFFNCDMQQAAHGRACAVATGVKRIQSNRAVFTYQGDGDLASIGIAETIHAANRGENITVIFVNNAIYGMTGGQMAPTTLIGQTTTTSPLGRDEKQHGLPIRMAELFATLGKVAYVERMTLHNPRAILKAKQSLKKAFTYQMHKRGFTIIKFLSTCPVGWGMTPLEALQWSEKTMAAYFPVGVLKDVGETHE